MEVILLQDIENLGKEGDVIRVKDGYGRNYLLPKKLAVSLSPEALKELELKKKRKKLKEEKRLKEFEEYARKINNLSITIPVEAGVDDKIFGTVTPDKIRNALRQEGLDLDKKDILIEEPVNKLGVFQVKIKFHPEVIATLRVWVVKK